MDTLLHLAKETELTTIGVTAASPDSINDKLLEEVRAILESSRSVKVMLDTCTGCGQCANACHSFLGTQEKGNIPAARADLLRNFYQKNCTMLGKIIAAFTDKEPISQQELEQWINYSYQCNLCRRCAYHCPLGIDTAEIVMAMRYALGKVGLVPSFIAGISTNLLKHGNNTGISKPAILDCCQFLEEELKDETGRKIKIPIDKQHADVLYIPSSTEFLYNVDTLLGVAKLFYALGISWTISSSITEAANYGMFINPDLMKLHNKRIVDAVHAVGAKLVVQGECGHGWRVAKMFSQSINGPIPFRLTHILELAAQNLTQLPLQKVEMRVTLHDSCNYARAGDLIDAPRQILKSCVSEFVEMTPNREQNYCCGGGSGLLMEEMLEVRMKLAKMKANQLQKLGRLDAVVAPCASCKAQLPHVIRHYKLDNVGKIAGVMEILGKSLKLLRV